MANWVYGFGFSEAEEHEIDRDRLGGKGASLAEMARMALCAVSLRDRLVDVPHHLVQRLLFRAETA